MIQIVWQDARRVVVVKVTQYKRALQAIVDIQKDTEGRGKQVLKAQVRSYLMCSVLPPNTTKAHFLTHVSIKAK